MTDINDVAREFGPDGVRAALDGAPLLEPEAKPNGHDVGSSLLCEPWWRDPATIPPRNFLYGRHYIRGAVGATIAAGGRGKTTLSVWMPRWKSCRPTSGVGG